jgi:hypothetical protein
MGEAVNSKKLLTKSYMTWRVVQAPGVWASIYRERIKRMGNYRSAIIFPEQLLGLNQNSVWQSFGGADGKSTTTSITRHGVLRLGSETGTRTREVEFFNRIEDVYEFEAKYSNQSDLDKLVMRSEANSYFQPKFHEVSQLFTNRNDAAKWCGRFIEASVSQI